MKRISYLLALIMVVAFSACTAKKEQKADSKEMTKVSHPEWTRDAVIYEVNLRQYTPEGTLKAFQQHLPRLKDLGVDVLWLMPIHPISQLNKKGELGSYYAVQNYKEVNPEFGTLDEFKEVVKQAHDMGFKVIIDWVANHTGGDNVWTKEHPDWYVRDSVGNFVSPYDWTDTYKLDYTNEDMRAGMLDALKYWVKEADIDGYRCDVAYEVPTDFWDNARLALDSIKPVFMLAEAEKPALTVEAFDAVYNWPLKNVMNEIAKDKKGNAAYLIDSLLALQDSIFPGDAFQMNHITNHDLNSWEGTEFDRLGDGVKAFAVLTYTLNGMPLLYTGQEVGMDKALEFFKKDTPPVWENNEWTEFYKKLNALKHSQPALKAGVEGGEMVRYETENEDAYVFSRSKDGSEVLVFLNLSDAPVKLVYKDKAPKGEYMDYFKGGKADMPAELGAWEYKVYIK